MACKKHTVEFTYSPAQPRAGQSISFYNQSDTGDEWEWSFGDISTSSSKNPTKVYKRPGTYTVTLKVDGKKNLTCTHEITIYDTVPTITYAQDTFSCPATLNIYETVTLSASVYNPYGHSLSYEWQIDETTCPHIVLTKNKLGQDSLTGRNLRVLLTEAQSYPVRCNIVERFTTNGRDSVRVYNLERNLLAVDKKAEAVLYTSAGTDYRQRYFYADSRYWFEAASSELKPGDKELLSAYCDTVCTYNGVEYRLSTLGEQLTFMAAAAPLGFYIADSRIYYRTADGLYVTLLSGANTEVIDARPIGAIFSNRVDNRFYWATADSLFYMPHIKSSNNKFDPKYIVPVGNPSDVSRIAVCHTPY